MHRSSRRLSDMRFGPRRRGRCFRNERILNLLYFASNPLPLILYPPSSLSDYLLRYPRQYSAPDLVTPVLKATGRVDDSTEYRGFPFPLAHHALQGARRSQAANVAEHRLQGYLQRRESNTYPHGHPVTCKLTVLAKSLSSTSHQAMRFERYGFQVVLRVDGVAAFQRVRRSPRSSGGCDTGPM